MQCEMPWMKDPLTQRCSVCGLKKEGNQHQCGYGTVPDPDSCSCIAAPQQTTTAAPKPEEKPFGETAIHEVGFVEENAGATGRMKTGNAARLRGMSSTRNKIRGKNTVLNPASNPGKLVSCSWTGVPDTLDAFVGSEVYYGRTRVGYRQHLFVASECTGGKLPDPREGIWLSSLHSVYSCGKPEQWSVISPNEQDGPGVMWYNAHPCDDNKDAANTQGAPQPDVSKGAARVRIDYYLPSKEQESSLHRCVWQGQGERFTKEGPTGLHRMSAEELSKRISFKPWQQSMGDLAIEPADDPGTVDSSTGGIMKKFQAPEDARFWSDKIGDDWKDTAPGYHRHTYTSSDCSHGLPPLDDESRHCLVSHRWGESCGCDGDWAVKGGKNSEGSTVPVPSVEWYTGQECSSTRIGTDYFCPNEEQYRAFDQAVHSCTFKGPGDVKLCERGVQESRNANDANQPGQCREHNFLASECTNGLPGLHALDADADCMVALREFSQCDPH